jgi:predicted nuclease of predicted toxin-antitoxin system
MKFLIDAQLPLRLSNLLAEANHDSIHTSGLPDSNRTGDRQLADIADSENRVMVTKDRDFRDSHLLQTCHAGSSWSPPATLPTTTCSPYSRPTSA